MQRTAAQNWIKSLLAVPRAWTRFWFEPIDASCVNVVRQGVGVLVGLLFLWSWFWVPDWLSADGWLGIDAGRYFIGDGMPGTGSEYRWSLLYSLATPIVGRVICVLGLVAGVLMVLGIARRWAPIGAWACMMMIHHRAPWLTMPAEVLASAALLYLAIEPGTAMFRKQREAVRDEPSSVLANLALRCLQVHWILWAGFSLASMFQQTPWWDGTALSILSEQGSGWFGKMPRGGWFAQILGVLALLLQASSLLCLCNRSLRGLGILLTMVLGISHLLLAGDWSMGLVACCYGLAFLPYVEPEKI
ncbi:MAG: hypothetical protein ACK5EO_14065 [Planctomycetota bacterium]